MSNVNIPTTTDWRYMDALERSVWGTAFAMALSLGTAAAAQRADQCVAAIRDAAPERNPPKDPAERAARIGIDIDRDAFGIWYETERRLQHGLSTPWTPLSQEQINEAYVTYAWGRSDFY